MLSWNTQTKSVERNYLETTLDVSKYILFTWISRMLSAELLEWLLSDTIHHLTVAVDTESLNYDRGCSYRVELLSYDLVTQLFKILSIETKQEKGMLMSHNLFYTCALYISIYVIQTVY